MLCFDFYRKTDPPPKVSIKKAPRNTKHQGNQSYHRSLPWISCTLFPNQHNVSEHSATLSPYKDLISL